MCLSKFTAAPETMAKVLSLLHLLFHFLIFPNFLLHAHSKRGGFSLKLIPRFSPKSPLYPGSLTWEEKLDMAIELSVLRAHYFYALSNKSSSSDPNNIHLKVHEQSHFYAVEIQLGTPATTQVMLMDTGSGLMWTQCQPCDFCFNQTIPIFNPDSSSSYQKLPCDHWLCHLHYQCRRGKCIYSYRYGGGSSTKGVMSLETFTFPYGVGRVLTLPGVIFGCSRDNRDFSFQNRNISGIMGLSRSPDSLVSQLTDQIRKAFSYCLVYAYRQMTATSVLRFGEDTRLPPRSDIKTTPLSRQNISWNYYVDLMDISVGDQRLRFPPGKFELKSNGSGGCVIDSGAMVTFLQEDAYDPVLREFDQHFASFGVKRVYNKSRELKFCYEYNPKFRAYASMTFHFRGADYFVEPAYMYYIYPSRGFFCVALASFKTTLVGAFQQQDMRVVYDLNRGVIRFAPENCALETLND